MDLWEDVWRGIPLIVLGHLFLQPEHTSHQLGVYKRRGGRASAQQFTARSSVGQRGDEDVESLCCCEHLYYAGKKRLFIQKLLDEVLEEEE